MRNFRRWQKAAGRVCLLFSLAILPAAVFAGPAAAAIAPIAQNLTPVAVPGGVELRGRVHPYGVDTHYHFEYGTTTAYGTDAPTPDMDIGSANMFVPVQQTVTGLAPNTTYHYRIAAVNEAGPGNSTDATFNTAELTTTPPPVEEKPPYEGETPPPKGGTVRLKMRHVKGKRILAATNGHTLYSLSVEKKGRFVCTGECLAVWKPVLVPTGGKVIGPVKLGSVKRPDGGRQATYRGLPLYTFAEDHKAGETNGEGAKDVGTWHAVKLPKPQKKH
jgi:predicted lipoprotein with Yx(FWY)xxD motif